MMIPALTATGVCAIAAILGSFRVRVALRRTRPALWQPCSALLDVPADASVNGG